MVLACTLGLVSIGHAQLGGRSIGSGSVPGAIFGGTNDPSNVSIKEGFHVIPSITVAERYDSNVYFVAKSPAVDRSDYVTAVAPQVRGLYRGSAMKLDATVGANAEYYAKNTNFNYVGANAGLSLDLSPMSNRLWEGMRFTVTDAFRYTPQSPSFTVGNQEGDTSSQFQTGQQVGRVDTSSNILNAFVIAPLTQTVSLTGSYTNGFLRFGSSQVQQAAVLLGSSYQTFTVGTSMNLSSQDILTLNVFNSEYEYEQGGGSFSSKGGLMGWTHAFSPAVTLVSTAGGLVVESQPSGTSTAQSTVAPRGSVVLTWKDSTTTLTMAYWSTVVPSNQAKAGPLLMDAVTFSMAQKTPIPLLEGLVSVNYGRGDEIGSTSVNPISYTAYQVGGGILYKFTLQTFLSLHYQYGNFDNQFGATNNSFDRHVVSISIAQAYY